MKRHVAALVAIVFLAAFVPATPRAAHEPSPSLSVHGLRGAPLPGAVIGAAPRSSGDYLPVPGTGGAPLPALSLEGPEPIGSVPASIYTASATWCKPRGNQCTGWNGDVYLGAVNSFRWGDPTYVVRVWRGQTYVDVTIVSFCRCRDSLHAIDLSVAAWTKLEPNLDIGRIDVLVEVLGEGPRVTLPPTSVGQ